MSGPHDLREAIRVLRIELGVLNDRVAQSAGLAPRDLDILDVIDRDGPCTPSHVTARTGVRAATLTGMLARLERDGWLRRQGHPDDSRSSLLSSSDRVGELRTLYARANQEVAALEQTLSGAERDLLLSVLTDLADHARSITSSWP